MDASSLHVRPAHRRSRLFGWLLVTLVCAGCSPTAGQKLVGSWKLDSGDGALGVLPDVELTISFFKDGRFEVGTKVPVVGTVTKSGKWRFLSIQDNVMRVEARLDGVEKPIEMSITLVDDNTIKMVPPAGPIEAEAQFRRVTAGES